MSTRFEFARRNAYYGYLSTLLTIVLGFAVRTVFIAKLGSAYLGVDALMTNILGVLSFLELGIGAAMSYSLYKPVAQGDIEKVRALARFYRKVYRIIALAVTIIGLSLLPLIPHLAQGAEGLGDLQVYYALFLASNVISYFAVYKTSIANAEQRRYLVVNIHTVASLILNLAQLAILLAIGSYLIYLLVMLLGRIGEQLFLNWYMNQRYTDYLAAPKQPISTEELEPIKKNVKALIWHKIGEVGVHQTDAIIIASFVNVTTLGMVSNYNLVINSITLFLSVTLSAALGSFGNAIATSAPADVYRNFKAYRLVAFWSYGLASIGMYVLLTPFISLWIGKEFTISNTVISLILINFYMSGHRSTVITLKTAGGLWVQDKYLPVVQTIINVVVSLVLVKSIGLIGVFIGTLAQGIVASIVRPIIVYPRLFNISPWAYFIDGARYWTILAIAGAGPIWLSITGWRTPENWWSFTVWVAAITVWTSAVFFVLLIRRPEAQNLKSRLSAFPRRR